MNELIKSIQFKIFITFFFTVVLCSLTTRINGDYGVIDGILGNILILCTFLLSTFFYSKFLAQYDSSKIFTSHLSRGIFRIILLSILPVIMIIQSSEYNNLLLIFFNYSIFYIYFELWYNDYKNDPPFFIGETAINDKIVRWINKNSKFMMNAYPLWYIAFKLILFVISFILLAIYWW